MTNNPLYALIPIVVALVPLLWAASVSWVRRIQFRNLILREIEEIGPMPVKPSQDLGTSWTDHHPHKRFLHKELLKHPTDNRDFILSLSPDLVYSVTQLWESTTNPKAWLHMLATIPVPWTQPSRRRNIVSVQNRWYLLMREYDALDVETAARYRPKKGDLTDEELRRLRALDHAD